MALAGNLTNSVIQLTPASAAFVRNRVDTLGPWVLGAFSDCILLGVVFSQVRTFFVTRAVGRTLFQRYCYWMVWVVLGLSIAKTVQEMAVVWVLHVHDYANPDVARTRVSSAWWQVTTPLMTGIIGFTVQSFFCLRFYLLLRNWLFVLPIASAMLLGITGISLAVFYIMNDDAILKVRWLSIHLVGVFVADLLITTGTLMALRKRARGLERTTVLINQLVRMVFESAIPPTVIAAVDLIMTQTLGGGPKLLWHLLLNFTLGKVYVISLLYTLNSINEYRQKHSDTSNQEIITADGHTILGMSGARRNNVELGHLSRSGLGSDRPGSESKIFIQTQVSTHVSPSSVQKRPIELHKPQLDNGRSSTLLEDEPAFVAKAY
ncbi:hypothetical protein MIND_01403300 [Mycena indigotica]|uniref:DUF6534 domain-containing protein n=1 Tax=Mycena indigotica TaxID=2126181 RepID=A0A8H6RW48_9AGAR|nr:uncharacterized protein MIND_01403300 [Mycena indigotica]KAF7288875.1 hypothetical protein MIND_01403300 [Mycena indigotica]